MPLFLVGLAVAAQASGPRNDSYLANLADTRRALDRSAETLVRQERKLQEVQQSEIIPEAGWSFPLGTRLAFTSGLEDFVFGSGAAALDTLTLLAGFRYSMVSIWVTAEFKFGLDHALAVLKLASASVSRDTCDRNTYDVSMDLVRSSLLSQSAIYEPSVLADGRLLQLMTLTSDATVIGQQVLFPHISFMHGGYYQLCYSPDGTMDETLNALVPVRIRVIGVASECLGNGCLARERWDCFVSYRGEAASVCMVDFRTFGGGRPGWSVESATYSKSAWSALWGSDSYVAGVYQPGEMRNCSDVATGEYISPELEIFEAFNWEPQDKVGFITDPTNALTMPKLKASRATESYSLSICYCPNYDGPVDGTAEPCDEASEYIQPVGVVHYWLVRVCDAENAGGCGVVVEPFMRILPQQPFSLRLQCPPGGTSCSGTGENRVKFLPAYCPLCSLSAVPEPVPLWDPGSRCRSGDDESERLVYHPFLYDEFGVLIDPGLYRWGGDRQDYKFWETPSLVGKLPMSDRLMVCYCDTECWNFYNFFEVGEIHLADSAGVARWSKAHEDFQLIQPIELVEYPTKAGGITLFAGIRSNLSEGMHPYDSIPWRRKSIMKILSLDNAAEHLSSDGSRVTLEEHLNLHRELTPAGRRGLDLACAHNTTSLNTVNGPDSIEGAKQFMAFVPTVPAQYLPFTGSENDQTFLFLEAGTYAVCYCSFLGSDDVCEAETGYIWAATIMVKGTKRDQNVILPTNFVVRIDLEGWGFTPQDSIRLITTTQTCYENAYSPKGVLSGFRLGCPGLDGTSCRLPVVEEDIKVYLISSERTGLLIESITIQETKSILHFTGDVTAEVLDGDQITLDESTILLDGRGQLSWTDHERHIISQLSGFYAFADEPQTTRMLWNRVSHVPGQPKQLSIPLGWREGERPDVTFLNGQGAWHRRNRLETEEEIWADQAAQLKICWGALDGPTQEYYGEAGQLTFTTPELMADAGLYFTSLVGGSVAPVILSWTPTEGKLDYRRDTAIVLRILFQEIPRNLEPLTAQGLDMSRNESISSEMMSQAACGRLFLEMWTNDVGGFPLPKGCYYGQLYTDVSENGQERPSYREFFIEFKPSHPMKDQCTGADGRKQSCVFQLVINMRVEEDEFQLEREIVSLYTFCAGRSGYSTICGPRYSIIEYGAVIPQRRIKAPQANRTELARVELYHASTALQAGPLGLGESDEALQLEASGSSTLGLRVFVRDGAYPIQRSGRLQIIFQPLTVWRLAEGQGQGCNATCIAAPELTCVDVRGLNEAQCQLKAVVDTKQVRDVFMQQNLLEIEYPNLMDEIPDDRMDEAHMIELRSLRLPKEGFFPMCTIAQYLEPPDMQPSMLFVTPCFKKAPSSGATTGQILVDGQAGNGPKPFAFEVGNEIIVRLTLGATLRNVPPPDEENITEWTEEERNLQPAQIQVLLPSGYLCSVVGNGTADPEGVKSFFQQDLNDDGWKDNPMSTLFSGEWSSEGSMCKYALEGTAALFANQFADVRISVQNPLRPLLKDDPSNVWRIQLVASNGETLGGPAQFLSLEEEKALPGWVGNLAVLGTLEGEVIQPSNFSENGDNILNVFFKMTRNMPIYSQILVDSPSSFDFTELCMVQDLEAEYYQDWEALPWATEIVGPRSTTSTLGHEVNCSVDDWQRPADIPTAVAPFTRAILQIGRTLIQGKYYAFQIYIKNAPAFNLTQHDGWRLWLQSPDGYMVDGSKYAVQFNAARVDSLPVLPHDRGWAVYPSGMKLPVNFSFGAERILPTAAFDMSAFLTVYPLEPTSDGLINSLRLIAPLGYVWIPFAQDGWLGYVPNVTCRYCQLVVTPQVKFQNELILPDLVMRVGHSFGFRVRLWVPLRPPTRSTNAFFLEMGFDPGPDPSVPLDRMQAAAIPAAPIRVVHDVFIFSRCNLAGFAENIMEITLRIASPLKVYDGFLFEGSEATRGFLLRCWPEVLSNMLGITPQEGACLVFQHPVNLLPMVKLWLISGEMPSGYYGFRFREVTLPRWPTKGLVYWRLGTFSDLHLYPQHKILDYSVDTPSPQILSFLPEAGILRPGYYEAPGFGRDDAPLRWNILSFYFRVGDPPVFPVSTETVVLALRGPRGFVFEEDCFGELHAFMEPLPGETATRFPCGTLPLASWCPRHLLSWPRLLAPVRCLGVGRTARIEVPNSAFVAESLAIEAPSFAVDGFYGFEIQVRNPEEQPESNLWALDFGYEASKPFLSIRIQSFEAESTTLQLACTVASVFWWPQTQLYLPFRIDFRPQTTIPAPRMLETRRLQSGSDPLLPEAEDGSLVILCPENFDFPKGDFDVCVNSLLERKDREAWDQEAFFSQSDVVCRVGDLNGLPETEGGKPEGRTMVFLLTNRKAILQGQDYTVEGRVRNPLEPTSPSAPLWRLESFQRFIATGQRVRLDSFLLQGPEVTPPAAEFSVSNRAGEYYGGVTVHEVEVYMVFPVGVVTGQSVVITAPPGVELQGNGTANSSSQKCLDFRWLGTYRPLRVDAEALCHCDRSSSEVACSLLMNVSHVPVDGKPVLEEGDPLSFRVSVVNPRIPRAAIRNFWKMTHWSAAPDRRPLSSAFAESWPIYGELANFTVWIAGHRQRANSESDLQVTFTPSVWGNTLEIIIHEPLGFDFSRVRPAAPYIKEISSQGSRVVLVNGDFRPGVLQEIFLGEVGLGQGGPTRISARLFSDFRMQTEVARRENMLNGFVQPGSVTITSQELLSQAVVQHYEGGIYDSVLPLLPCFAQQLSRMEFFFRLSRYATAGNLLVLRNLGQGGHNHEFYLEDGFEPMVELCHGQDGGRNASSTSWQCSDRVVRVNYTGKVYTRNNFDIVNGFTATLLRMSPDLVTQPEAVSEIAYLTDGRASLALEANRNYRIRMWLLPTLMQTQWYIATQESSGSLTNTNDGEISAPTAVPQMSLSVSRVVSRSPPNAAIYLTVTVKAGAGQLPFSRLLLLLPYNFIPVGSQVPSTGRAVLELDVTSTNPLEEEMSYQLRMLTPSRSNLDPRWFVLSRSLQVDEVTGEVSDQIVGWSFYEGFGVEPCPVTARYGAIPSYTGWLALTFKVPDAAKGRFALFTAPQNFQIRCPAINQAKLPCEPFQLDDGMPNNILILPVARTLNLTLVSSTAEGQDLVYAAMLIIVTPELLLSLHPWQLRVLDQAFTVIDSSLEIPSAPMSAELQADNPTLRYLTAPQRGEAATVAIQVILNRRIRTLRMLVFLMPEGYRHDIQHANQLANINKNFPVAIEREWRDSSNLRRVRVIIQPTTVSSGTFEWQFPVIVAPSRPINTEWYVFFCSDYSCTEMSDPSVFVVFPVPDFQEKRPAKSFGSLMVAGAGRRLTAGCFGWLYLGWLCYLAAS
ncbi:unnamed protein product [Durusdinium trenchii]|uniref:Uncharacterized protein n=1 Tax=Durusdinium trenchii TaxID=1381693 RepID=A0ABP0QHR8_9DINO